MNAWTQNQVLVIARRVLADPCASDDRKAWARAALACGGQQERRPADVGVPKGNVETEKAA